MQLILISSVDYTVPQKVSAALHQVSVPKSAEQPAPEAAKPGGNLDKPNQGGIAIGPLPHPVQSTVATPPQELIRS